MPGRECKSLELWSVLFGLSCRLHISKLLVLMGQFILLRLHVAALTVHP